MILYAHLHLLALQCATSPPSNHPLLYLEDMTPLFGVYSGRFLGWWDEQLVWRNPYGDPIGYLEAALHEGDVDEEGKVLPWPPKE